MILHGTCIWCGKPFTADSRHSTKKKHCSKACARRTYVAAGNMSPEARRERDERAKRTSEAPGPDALYDCRCPTHDGEHMLGIGHFYRWLTTLGRPTRSTWCRNCLKQWLLENGMREDHGQHSEADDQARIEIYEDRLATFHVGGKDAIHLATRLMSGKHVA